MRRQARLYLPSSLCQPFSLGTQGGIHVLDGRGLKKLLFKIIAMLIKQVLNHYQVVFKRSGSAASNGNHLFALSDALIHLDGILDVCGYRSPLEETATTAENTALAVGFVSSSGNRFDKALDCIGVVG
jgi:hypothetical protein